MAGFNEQSPAQCRALNVRRRLAERLLGGADGVGGCLALIRSAIAESSDPARAIVERRAHLDGNATVGIAEEVTATDDLRASGALGNTSVRVAGSNRYGRTRDIGHLGRVEAASRTLDTLRAGCAGCAPRTLWTLRTLAALQRLLGAGGNVHHLDGAVLDLGARDERGGSRATRSQQER